MKEKTSNFFEIIPYIKCAMSEDYFSMLPENFFENFTENCSYLTIEKINLKKDFEDLNSEIIKIKNIFTSSSYVVNDYSFYINDVGRFQMDQSSGIVDFPSPSNYIRKHSLSKKALDEMYEILSYFYKIDYEKSSDFKSLCSDIKILVSNNPNIKFPRSYLNFSVFQYSIDGYPYKTSTNRIWSISNVKYNSDDEDKADIYFKNINAIVDGLYHLNTNFKGYKAILKNAYAAFVLLSALYSEEMYKEKFIRDIIKSKKITINVK